MRTLRFGWSSLALALFAVAAVGCARGPMVSSNLPLRRVVVYRNGVGYFERGGHVDQTEVKFRMRQGTIGDFLATLAIVERGGSTVRSASFPVEVADKFLPQPQSPYADLLKRPEDMAPKERNPLREVTLRLDGEDHDLAVGYVAETPLWRPSYRVVIGKDGQAALQSWGIVQNLSGEDWNNVQLVLVAGAPLAFQSTLGNAIVPQRPIVTDTGEVISAMPTGVTSLNEKDKGSVDRYVPEEAPSPTAASPAAAPMAESGDMKSDEAGFGSGQGRLGGMRAPRPASAGPGKESPKKESPKKSTQRYSTNDAAGLPSGAAMAAPMVAPPPPPPGVSPSAPRDVRALASVAVDSGATRYELPFPVTLPDENATMVLLSSVSVPGQSVFLFAPDGGVADSATHPFRVARFTNATKGLLERGPIAVFEQGSFLGQGMLDSLPPGATATVPFALERGIGVESHQRWDERGARLFKIESGSLTLERDRVRLTTYAIKNGGTDAAKVLVRHPRQPGWRLFRPPTGTEDNTGIGSALIPMDVRASARAELVVDEREAQQQGADWLSPLADEAVKAYLADNRSDRGQVEKLATAWGVRATWKKLVDEQSALETERQEIERNASQLREGLEAIQKNPQAAELRTKLGKKLEEASLRLDRLSKRAVELGLAMREQEVRFRDAILEVKILSVPPPKQ